MDSIDALAIILSVVSLVVTVVGFFASLKFYRDGVELQGKANDALTKIEEKTAFIQTQVGGIFDKTLDAAIGKREALSEKFTELYEQLEASKAKITEESLSQIGAAGEQERDRIKQFVAGEIEQVQEKVESTRESAEELVETAASAKSAFRRVDNVLTWEPERWLTSKEIAQHARLRFSQVEPLLKRMADNEYLETKYDGAKTEYRLAKSFRDIWMKDR